MSQLLVLPTPLASTSITLGQLLTDPLYAESASLKPPSIPTQQTSTTQAKYEDTVAHDDHGRFTSTRFVSRLSGQPHYSHENLLLLNAEQMSHTTIASPAAVFTTLRRDPTTRAFLRNMACLNRPVYFVTGLQTLTNPSFKRAVVQHGLVAEATAPLFRLPVRRVDSAASLDKAAVGEEESVESILAVELLKVKCRVGANSEPHCISDLDYNWSYHALEEEDLQLSIGLGKPVEAAELRALAGSPGREEYSEASWDSQTEASEDGIGGF